MLKKVNRKVTETFYARALTLEYLDQHYRQNWDHLAACCLEPNIFYTPSFLMALCHNVMPDKKIMVITTWRQSDRHLPELTGIYPFVEKKFLWGRPVKLLQSLIHPYLQSTTPLLHKDYAEQSLINFLDFLEEQHKKYNAITMPFLPSDGAFYQLFLDEMAVLERPVTLLSGYKRAALFSDLAPDDYVMKAMSKRRRKDVRRCTNNLAKQGEISHFHYDQPQDLPHALALFLDLEASGWKGAKGTALKSSAATAAFANAALNTRQQNISSRYDFMSIDGKIIAATLTLIHQDRAWTYKAAYDESYGQYAPSVQAFLELTKKLLTQKNISLSDSCALPGSILESVWTQRVQINEIIFASSDKVSHGTISRLALAHKYFSKARQSLKQLVLKIRK